MLRIRSPGGWSDDLVSKALQKCQSFLGEIEPIFGRWRSMRSRYGGPGVGASTEGQTIFARIDGIPGLL